MENTLQNAPPFTQHHEKEEEEEKEKQEFTCEICIEPTSNKFSNHNKCSHPFCTDCVIKYIRVKLEHDNVGNIKCPAVNCDHTLDPLACASYIGPPLFVRWCDVLCETALVDRDKCYCPYPNCNELIVNECGGKPKKSTCPSCKRLLCFQCKRIWHAGFGCEESRIFSDRNDIAFGTLAELKSWMRCPSCKHFVELNGGCWIVQCRCRFTFCYKCGEPVNPEYGCQCDKRAPSNLTDGEVCAMFSLLFVMLAIFIYFCIISA